jgi:hypothetical protein
MAHTWPFEDWNKSTLYKMSEEAKLMSTATWMRFTISHWPLSLSWTIMNTAISPGLTSPNLVLSVRVCLLGGLGVEAKPNGLRVTGPQTKFP